MLRPHGYNRIEGGPEGLLEEDTVKCNHRQHIGFVQPGGRIFWPHITTLPQGITTGVVPRDYTFEQFTCRQCYAPICPYCANLPCMHFEKWLEEVERKGEALHDRLLEMQERVGPW